MTHPLKTARIAFIDDQKNAISSYMQHLKEEDFTNVVYLKTVKSFNEVVQLEADLIFLDITGVASTLNSEDEGISVLGYIKKHRPWTRVVVLSGSDFPASKAKQLSEADACITKASLNLADLVNLTEDELRKGLAPEFRNVQILEIVEERFDELAIGWFKQRKLRKLIATAKQSRGDANFDWDTLVEQAQTVLSTAANVASIAALLSGK